jgi:inner membrane protein
MDNVTHSLIGLVAGESMARLTHARQTGLSTESRRGLFVSLFVIGGNLPDLDLLYSFRGFSDGTQAKLAYMLQHRGYTHTIVGCVLLGLILYAGAELWARWKRLCPSPRDRVELAAMSLLGTSLHLAMDFMNSYGVHPFWPLLNRWFYGDSVFIVEPLYWAAAAPLLFVLRSRVARVLLGLALLVALMASVLFLHLEPIIPRVGLVLLMLALLLVGSRTSARTAAVVSAGAMIVITGSFIAAGHWASRRVASIVAVEFPADRVIDHVLTPLPANPLCWDVLLLATRDDRYTVRHALLSNAPALIPVSHCTAILGNSLMTAPVENDAAVQSDAVRWLGQFEMSRSELAALVARHCDAAAVMQFARAPFATELGSRWVVGDLRFDRERGSGMATIALGSPSHSECRPSVPWIPPREDLLGASSPSFHDGR